MDATSGPRLWTGRGDHLVWWGFRWWERLRSLAGGRVCVVPVGALSGDDSGIWWEVAYAWSRWEFRRIGDWQPSVDRDGAYGNGTIDRTHGWAPWDSARAVRSLRWAALTRLTCLFAVSESAGAAR